MLRKFVCSKTKIVAEDLLTGTGLSCTALTLVSLLILTLSLRVCRPLVLVGMYSKALEPQDPECSVLQACRMAPTCWCAKWYEEQQ
eukprot:5610333-Amphidinium_carterae.1